MSCFRISLVGCVRWRSATPEGKPAGQADGDAEGDAHADIVEHGHAEHCAEGDADCDPQSHEHRLARRAGGHAAPLCPFGDGFLEGAGATGCNPGTRAKEKPPAEAGGHGHAGDAARLLRRVCCHVI